MTTPSLSTQTEISLATTAAHGQRQDGFLFDSKQKSLRCQLTTMDRVTVDSLACSVTEWSRIAAGNVKKQIAQNMGGRTQILVITHGHTLTLDTTTLARIG